MTAARNWLLLLFVSTTSDAWAVISPIAITGDSVPGIPGAQFASFGNAQLNADGQGVYSATLQIGPGGISTANDRALVSFNGGLTLNAQTGSGNVAGAAGTDYLDFLEYKIADSGDVLLKAKLAETGGVTPDNNLGFWRYSNGTGSLITRTGTSAAPGSAAPYDHLGARVGTTPSGDFAFDGQLQFVNGVDGNSDLGVWLYDGGTGTLIAQENSAAPGVVGGVFHGFTPPAINTSKQIAFRASVKTGPGITGANRIGMWLYNDGEAGELIARNGSGEVPDSTSDFSTFGDALMNEAGQVVFHATLATGQQGLWRYMSTEGTNLAITNEPGIPGLSTASFASLSKPLLIESGQVAAVGTLTLDVGGVTADNDSGLWLFGDESGGKLLAREGIGGVAGVSGASFSSFERVAAIDDTAIYVEATLQTAAGIVDSTNDEGIWRIPFDGSPELIVRRGDTLAGRTIADLWLPAGQFDEVPLEGISNDSGEFLFHASFTNGDAGLFLYSPGTVTEFADADFDHDGDVDGADLAAWQDAYGVSAAGDADNDGDSDGADFLTWQRQYTGPGTLTEVRAVPEPGVSLLLVVSVIAAQCRRRRIL